MVKDMLEKAKTAYKEKGGKAEPNIAITPEDIEANQQLEEDARRYARKC